MSRIIIVFLTIFLLGCRPSQTNENNNLEYRNALIKELKFIKGNTADNAGGLWRRTYTNLQPITDKNRTTGKTRSSTAGSG
jgi:hypothetical protein